LVNVALYSFSARTATADNVIAVWFAGVKPGSINGAAPITGTSRVLRDDWIIATGNVSIVNVTINEQHMRA